MTGCCIAVSCHNYRHCSYPQANLVYTYSFIQAAPRATHDTHIHGDDMHLSVNWGWGGLN